MLQRLRSLSGLQRQLCLSLAWLAVALYTLAPAIPRQYMPAFMDMAMPDMPGMAHMAMAMPADCPMNMAAPRAVSGTDQDGKKSDQANSDCPICKVAATAVLLASPPALPNLKPEVESRIVASLWLPPSQRVFSAQPRGPPTQI